MFKRLGKVVKDFFTIREKDIFPTKEDLFLFNHHTYLKRMAKGLKDLGHPDAKRYLYEVKEFEKQHLPKLKEIRKRKMYYDAIKLGRIGLGTMAGTGILNLFAKTTIDNLGYYNPENYYNVGQF